MAANFVVGLDIGTTKTCAVIGELITEPGRHPTVKIVGVGQARTNGVRDEVVTNIEEMSNSVRTAMKEAEFMSGVVPDRVYVGLSAGHVETRLSPGVVAIGGAEITGDDVSRVHEVARAVALPADRELMHAVPQEYIVDHKGGIKDPIGMSGTRLETEVCLVACEVTPGANVRKAVTKAGYRVQELVVEPFASSRAVLTEDEKEVGVAIVEIGGATSDLVVFHEGKIHYLKSFPFGGVTITRDLVQGLALPFNEARRAFESYGAASASMVDPHEVVELPGPAPGQLRPVAREIIAHVIEERLDEMLGLIRDEMVREGLHERLGAGVVITGGTAALPGIIDFAEGIFAHPVRLGCPGEGLSGLAESVGRPRFSVATGLALYGAERFKETGRGVSTAASGLVTRVGAWLKEFF